MELTFTRPDYLWFLVFSVPILIVSHFLSLWYTKRRALKFSSFEAIEKISGRASAPKDLFILFLRILILFVLVFSISGAVIWYYGEASDSDFVIALDASSSMLASDYSPNRLEAAKSAALAFVDSAPPGARIGVISFSGSTYIKHKLSDDQSKVRDSIRSIEVEYMGGTAIGEAIITSCNLLLSGERGRVIILLTDGQNNVGINPADAVSYANENLVTIYTIGIGTKTGGKVAGMDMISKIDEETLEDIAKNTGGKYFHAESLSSLVNSFKEIAKTGKKKISIALTPYLLFILVALLFLDWGVYGIKYLPIRF